MEEWVEKYRPRTLDDLMLSSNTKDMCAAYLKKNTFPNSMLVGRPGTGKTSLAKIVVNTIPNCTHLFINASADINIGVVRGQLAEYCEATGFDGGLKFVILDEIDGIKSEAAENALKTLIEDCISDTRFILTGNKSTKLLEALKSRCTPIQLPPPPLKEIFNRLKLIMDEEGIEYTKNDLKLVTTEILQQQFPKIRDMIKHLEMCCISGKFKLVEYSSDENLEETASHIIKNIKNWKKCREYWIKNEMMFSRDYIALAGKIFNILENPAQLNIVGEHLYRMNLVLDQEIQFATMMLQLGQLK